MFRIIKKTPYLFLLFFIFTSIEANTGLEYLIKTMSWKQIRRSLSESSVKNELEAYALIRYHEESGEGSKDEKLRLLYAVVTGLKPKTVGKAEVSYLLSHSIMEQTNIVKLCFWKLYLELKERNLLPEEKRVDYLRKVKIEEDPIIVKVYENIVRVYKEDKKYLNAVLFAEKLQKSSTPYLYTEPVQRMQALCLLKLGREKEARKLYLSLTKKDNISYSIKRRIIEDLKDNFGKSYLEKLSTNEIAGIVNMLPQNQQKEFIQKENLHKKGIFKYLRLFKNVAYSLIRHKPSDLEDYLKRHKDLVSIDKGFLHYSIKLLLSKKETSIAKSILNTYLSANLDAETYESYLYLYQKLKDKENYFKYLILYLEQQPYNMGIQDKLIDFLADHSDKKISYKPEKYWEESIKKIPNLPIKGRLIYWYLRFLKDNGKITKLKDMLDGFHYYCPGSYYNEVIKSEFAVEINTLKDPPDPLGNVRDLHKYLSLNNMKKYSKELRGKDLYFAYYDNSKELGEILSKSSTIYESDPFLQKSISYFKLGEYINGIWLANRHVEQKKLNTAQKYILYVALGDLSSHQYLSLYYTRLLMKIKRIPDEPVLLPASITSRLYPRPHGKLVTDYSKKFSISKNVVYAVMRQESFFREEAISPAKARGLMQVMPATGRVLAKGLKVSKYSLHDPEISIMFGARFLADLLKMYKNDLRWATIGYNGGPGNLRKWKRNHYHGDFNHFLENLPSRESRNYCRIVISNYINYRVLESLNTNPVSD